MRKAVKMREMDQLCHFKGGKPEAQDSHLDLRRPIPSPPSLDMLKRDGETFPPNHPASS
jgi:hypothetical protein